MVNLKDFIKGDEVLYTKAFQDAIDYCYEKGGEPLYVPFGVYTLGSVSLKDNTTIIFEDGVKILGSTNILDFFDEEPILNKYQDLSHSSYTRSMFYAKNVKNVTLKGNATIDMQSAWDVNKVKNCNSRRGAKIIALDGVDGVNISDLKLLNATDIAVLLGRCKNCFIKGLYIDTHIDGISPDGSENVVISDCIVKSGDDSIVFKSSYYDDKLSPCQRITVTNCIMKSRCTALKIGTETNGDFKNITVSNCVIYDTRCMGIAVESCDGSHVEGIIIDNITMHNVACPIFVFAGKRMRAPEDMHESKINDVFITNVFADTHNEPYESKYFAYSMKGSTKENWHEIYEKNFCFPSMIVNYTSNPMNNIVLQNVSVKVVGGKKMSDINYKHNPTGTPSDEMFGPTLPCYGLFVVNTPDLKLNNVKFELINPDERPETYVE